MENQSSSESSESSSSAEPVTAFNAPTEVFPNTAIPVEPDHYPPLDPAASEAQAEQVAPAPFSAPKEPPAPEPKTAMDFVRAIISTVVACINSHCNQPSDADAKIRSLKLDIGDGLSAFEHMHLTEVFRTIKAGPAPINPLPEAPAPEAPLPPVVPAPTYPGINTGFAK